jgi:hypothetical protein
MTILINSNTKKLQLKTQKNKRLYLRKIDPHDKGPRLALVACTLAYNLMKVIEELNGTDISPIVDVQQIAAEGDCDVLAGYCEFLREWWHMDE